MNMNHIYSCKQLNNENIEVPYESIFSEEIHKQKIVQERFKKNLEKLENKTKFVNHGIPKGDPLYDYAVMEINWLIDDELCGVMSAVTLVGGASGGQVLEAVDGGKVYENCGTEGLTVKNDGGEKKGNVLGDVANKDLRRGGKGRGRIVWWI